MAFSKDLIEEPRPSYCKDFRCRKWLNGKCINMGNCRVCFFAGKCTMCAESVYVQSEGRYECTKGDE